MGAKGVKREKNTTKLGGRQRLPVDAWAYEVLSWGMKQAGVASNEWWERKHVCMCM